MLHGRQGLRPQRVKSFVERCRDDKGAWLLSYLFDSITPAAAEANVIVFVKRVRGELDALDLAHNSSQP